MATEKESEGWNLSAYKDGADQGPGQTGLSGGLVRVRGGQGWQREDWFKTCWNEKERPRITSLPSTCPLRHPTQAGQGRFILWGNWSSDMDTQAELRGKWVKIRILSNEPYSLFPWQFPKHWQRCGSLATPSSYSKTLQAVGLPSHKGLSVLTRFLALSS